MNTSRRAFLSLLAASTASACAVRDSRQAQADSYSDKEAAAQWMDQWIRDRKAPDGVLHVARFADPTYYLIKEIGWTPNPGQTPGYSPVRVPIGFVTDFASIPRLFWSALRPDGVYTYPAIVHDYLYWNQNISRAAADDILRFAMEDFRVDAATIAAVYRGVRVGGGFAWDENARLKAAGEKRVLKRWPTDPRVRWIDWKADPSVFG